MLIIVTIILSIFMFRQGRMFQFGKGGKALVTISILVINAPLIWILSLQLSFVTVVVAFIIQNFVFSTFAFVIGMLSGVSPEAKVSSELKALNRCDGCGTTFRDFYGLKKVEGKGFLCVTCRSTNAVEESRGPGTGHTD